MKLEEFDFNCYRWSVENVRLDFLTHAESFFQKKSDGDEKPFHSHVYYELLFSASDGSAEFLYGNKRLLLSRSSFVITAPYFSHRTVVHRHEDLFSLGFLYKPNNQKELPKQDLYRLFNEVFSGNDCIIGIGDENLSALCSQLKKYSNAQDLLAEDSLVAAFLLVLFHVLSFLRNGTGRCTLVKRFADKSGKHITRIPNEIASKINNILSEAFMTDVTPEELSGKFYISAKQINRYIYNQYGQTFMQRKNELRMLYAQRLLRESELSILEISERVGYRSINSFYSAFKAFFGLTPHQYRVSGELYRTPPE